MTDPADWPTEYSDSAWLGLWVVYQPPQMLSELFASLPDSPDLQLTLHRPLDWQFNPFPLVPFYRHQLAIESPDTSVWTWITAPWWLCPNTPRCPHSGVVHDIEFDDDALPRCTMDGCPRGEKKQTA